MALRRWEYMVLDIGVDSFFTGPRLNGDALATRLNELGADGWEVVGMSALDSGGGRTRDVVLVLKRPND